MKITCGNVYNTDTHLQHSDYLAPEWEEDVMMIMVLLLIPENSKKKERVPFNCSTNIYCQVLF